MVKIGLHSWTQHFHTNIFFPCQFFFCWLISRVFYPIFLCSKLGVDLCSRYKIATFKNIGTSKTRILENCYRAWPTRCVYTRYSTKTYGKNQKLPLVRTAHTPKELCSRVRALEAVDPQPARPLIPKKN